MALVKEMRSDDSKIALAIHFIWQPGSARPRCSPKHRPTSRARPLTNGKLFTDQGKAITAISYNYLNLPGTLSRSSGGNILTTGWWACLPTCSLSGSGWNYPVGAQLVEQLEKRLVGALIDREAQLTTFRHVGHYFNGPPQIKIGVPG
jgi:hypothetical protein